MVETKMRCENGCTFHYEQVAYTHNPKTGVTIKNWPKALCGKGLTRIYCEVCNYQYGGCKGLTASQIKAGDNCKKCLTIIAKRKAI